MLSLWKEVLKDPGDGKLAFIDVSAVFVSVRHVNLLRKLQAIGYNGGELVDHQRPEVTLISDLH